MMPHPRYELIREPGGPPYVYDTVADSLVPAYTMCERLNALDREVSELRAQLGTERPQQQRTAQQPRALTVRSADAD